MMFVRQQSDDAVTYLLSGTSDGRMVVYGLLSKPGPDGPTPELIMPAVVKLPRPMESLQKASGAYIDGNLYWGWEETDPRNRNRWFIRTFRWELHQSAQPWDNKASGNTYPIYITTAPNSGYLEADIGEADQSLSYVLPTLNAAPDGNVISMFHTYPTNEWPKGPFQASVQYAVLRKGQTAYDSPYMLKAGEGYANLSAAPRRRPRHCQRRRRSARRGPIFSRQRIHRCQRRLGPCHCGGEAVACGQRFRTHALVYRPKILPGFMMSSGSSARLIARMVANAGCAVLGQKIFHLALADAVLAGAGAVHGDGALGEPGEKFLRAPDLVGVVAVDQQQHMEIAVADMADHRRQQPARRGVALAFADAFGEPRDRHTDIRRQRLYARPQPLRRPIGVVPRLPQPACGPRRASPNRTGRRRDLARSRRSAATARRRSPRYRETRQTASALPAATASSRDCSPAPAAHPKVRCAPPECRTGW